jgi:hypothetical protein
MVGFSTLLAFIGVVAVAFAKSQLKRFSAWRRGRTVSRLTGHRMACKDRVFPRVQRLPPAWAALLG